MKTSVNTSEVSLPPAHEAGWGVKVRAEHGGGSKNTVLVLKNGLVKPGDGRIIEKMLRKNQFDTTNDRSNAKSRFAVVFVPTDLLMSRIYLKTNGNVHL